MLSNGEFIDLVLLAMLALTALRIIFLKDLFAVVMLFGIYSFLSALIFVNLDAVDVAFTELMLVRVSLQF